MSKKEKTDWLNLKPVSDHEFKPEDAGCLLPAKTGAEREYLFNRHVSDWVDGWIISQKDGTSVLNGKVEDFKKALKEFVDDFRTDW